MVHVLQGMYRYSEFSIGIRAINNHTNIVDLYK